MALASAAPAFAQSSMAQCHSSLPPAAAARLKACDAHAGCRAVVRIIDNCPALQTFLQHVANSGGGQRVDDGVLRRALVDAGVPATGLASCTSAFNRALCRNFLHLEDASGETAGGPTRAAQFDDALRRLVEQQERARVPADAHRHAEQTLEACGAARPGPERDAPCREAIQAVQACELAVQVWTQRREVLRVDAQRLNRTAAQQTLRALQMPPCPQTVPATNLTPQQALVAAAADVPDAPGRAANVAPAARPTPTLAAAPTAAPTATPTAARQPAAPSAPRATGGDTVAGGDCRVSLRRMEERFEGMQRRRPAAADRLATQQVELLMLTEQIGLLERVCRGQREYEFLRPTQAQLARALQGCRESAANPARDCVPRAAW